MGDRQGLRPSMPSSSLFPLPRRPRFVVSALLFAAALAIRLPYLQLIPRFEDEGVETLWALDIAQGWRLPLTGFDAYYGPLFSYLVAGLFRIFGPSLFAPRLMIATFGALTVPAVYHLGRVVAHERVGLVAAFFALVSPMLVVVSSHQGWSNSMTPFLATVTLTAAYVGVTQRRTGVLALAGLLAGLTLQTHPLSLVLLLAVVLWYLLSRPPRAWFSDARLDLTIVAFAVGYAPMIWKLASQWTTVMHVVQRQTYAYAPVESFAAYQQRLPQLETALVNLIGGVGERLGDALAYVFYIRPVRTSLENAMETLVAGGLVLSALFDLLPWTNTRTRRSRVFVAIVFILSVLLLPLITPTINRATSCSCSHWPASVQDSR
jgi:4-amino-4-deoxy-L-arabinose transferase-like glycosyltransferase